MMRPTARPFVCSLALVTPVALLSLGGCVNQDAYDGLQAQNRALQAQNQELLDRNKALDEANRELMARIGKGDMTEQQMAALIAQLQDELANKNKMLSEFDGRFKDIQVGTLLDPQTDAALKEFAARFPHLLSYDADRGMVRFNSDITFASGDFTLTPSAKQAIGEFARLLRETPSAAQYDLRVIGHTDTQPVRQIAGRRFRDNDELSAFRSISVANEFSANGMPRQRVEFAGFGSSRPAVNQTGNVPANRRVEVYLVKSTWNGTTLPSTPVTAQPVATTPVKPATTRTPDIMK